MLIIGPHISISKGFKRVAMDIISIGANTFQFFSRNPMGSKAKSIDLRDIAEYEFLSKEHNLFPPLCHGPYTLNMASETEKTREFALMVFQDDLDRMEQLPTNLYVFHPGSSNSQSKEQGIELIVDIMNKSIKETHTTNILLETMSGKGSEVGSTFDELKTIIDNIDHKEKVGVCFDTCHTYSAGYDIVNNLDGVLEEFDKKIGLDKIKAIHLNDTKNPFDSRKDRHAGIGEGALGLDAIVNFINHDKLKHLPFYLETPHDTLEGYGREVALLQKMYN